MGVLLLKVLALAKLPSLNSDEEEECSDEDYTPLPADPRVPEHGSIDNRDVQYWEDCDESAHDREEEELVAPHIMEPLGEVLVGTGLHHEERAAHVDHLPRKEDREPGKTSESRSTGAEYSRTTWVEPFVTTGTKVTVAKAEHDDREGSKTESGNPETVEEHINHDFDGENTPLELEIVVSTLNWKLDVGVDLHSEEDGPKYQVRQSRNQDPYQAAKT